MKKKNTSVPKSPKVEDKDAQEYIYIAQTRRNEPGLGFVEKGTKVALESHLDIEQIANLVHARHYGFVGEPNPEVLIILEELKAG